MGVSHEDGGGDPARTHRADHRAQAENDELRKVWRAQAQITGRG